MESSDHLFRREAGRMVAVLTRAFGVQNLALAEDVVQDAFLQALEVWKVRGVPDNPSAWLMATAKNRALDVLRRRRTARTSEPELARLLESEWTLSPAMDELFTGEAIKDAMLRMMFSCCHPRLAEESQVALILNVLCGFGIDEAASAFVVGYAAMEKRITRAKKTMAGSKRLFEVSTAGEFIKRLPGVRGALYLLFNEGYHGASSEKAVRQELCREAMRLTALLLEHPNGGAPETFALAALMSLDAARLPARVDTEGDLSPLADQDRGKWDRQLIAEGLALLELSASGAELSEYHIEAAIAAVHSRSASLEDTDWAAVVSLYDALEAKRRSPVVAFNRAIAIGERDGPQAGRAALLAVPGADRLRDYPFYFAALGEFELRLGSCDEARAHFRNALGLARNAGERRHFERRIDACAAERQA